MDFIIPILNTLAIAIVLILLMVGLMSAPWQVLLLILLLGILAYQWLVRRDHLEGVLADVNADIAKNSVVESSRFATNGSKTDAEALAPSAELSIDSVLHYRGVSYAPPATSETLLTTVEITGRYRGGVHKSSVRVIEERATFSNLSQDNLTNR